MTGMRIRGALAVAGLLAVACATVTAPPGLPRPATPVTDPAERIRLPGFSIAPPPGAEWYLSSEARGPRDVVFYKRVAGAPPSHTLYVRAVAAELRTAVTNAAALRAVLARDFERERRDAGRTMPMRSRSAVDTSLGRDCVRSETFYEERENPGLGGVLVLVQSSLACLHPSAPTRVIILVLSERYAQGDSSRVDAALRQEVETFFRSVEFTPLP
jgi:hypothetical protein